MGQPAPFKGTILFNLSLKEYGKYLNSDDLDSMDIRLLAFNKDSEFRYDSLHNAFAFTTVGFEEKEFAIIYKSDTIFINYPSLPILNAVFIKAPIPLKGISYSFSSKQIYDAIHSNKNFNEDRIFNLCHGCFISDYYRMPEEIKTNISKDIFNFTIQLKK
jgi:hypothetical protein